MLIDNIYKVLHFVWLIKRDVSQLFCFDKYLKQKIKNYDHK